MVTEKLLVNLYGPQKERHDEELLFKSSLICHYLIIRSLTFEDESLALGRQLGLLGTQLLELKNGL